MLKYLMPAAAMLVMASSSAWALPAAATNAATINKAAQVESNVVTVHDRSYRSRRSYNRHRSSRHHHYVAPRHHYYHGGRNWRYRYYSRPYNWHRRHCVQAGPLWFCP